MKTLITLALLILTLSSYSQLGVHFADSNAFWKTNYSWLPPGPFGYNAYAENYISGDTVINDLQYKKISHTGYDVFCTDIITSGPNYIGALREDIDVKKVYFIPSGHIKDTLLYDYNLQVGDTLPLGYNTIPIDSPMYVSSIDTIESNDGLLRMRWNLSAEYHGQFGAIIEGIGSTAGLVENVIVFEEGSFLRCYYQNDSVVYSNANQCAMPTDTCFYLGSPEFLNQDKTKFSCSPNPVFNRLVVSTQDQRFENLELGFYDQFGNKVKSVIITRSREEINVSNLKSGMYYLVMRKQEQIVQTQKLIKN